MESLAILVGKIVEEAVAIFCAHYAIDKLEVYSEEKEQVKVTMRLLFEHWFQAVCSVFQAQGYEEVVIEQFFSDYGADWETFIDWESFIKDQIILEEFFKSFSLVATSYTIDAQLLQERWQALELQALPKNIDMASICRAFSKRLQEFVTVTPEEPKETLRQMLSSTWEEHRKVKYFRGHLEMLPWLRRVATDEQEPDGVRSQAIEAWANYLLHVPPMIQQIGENRLLQYGLLDAVKEVITNLARYFYEHPETLPLIQQFASDKQESDEVRSALVKHFREISLWQRTTDRQVPDQVRSNAIKGLIGYFYSREQPETLPLLQQIAIDKQESDEVRNNAIEILAKHFYKDSEILPLLQQIASDKQEDERVCFRAKFELERASVNVRCDAVNGLIEHPEKLPLLRQIASDKQESDEVRNHAIKVLAEHFREHPETLLFLQQIATDKQEPGEIRSSVIFVLARCFGEHPKILPLLRRIASDKQEDKELRDTAIKAFTSTFRFRQYPETLPLVWQMATDKQEFNEVRDSAIRALAYEFRWHPDAWLLLRQIATDKQESDEVRCRAIQYLAENFREHPETLPWLRKIATDKQESDKVRCRAIQYLVYNREHPEILPLLRQIVADKQEPDGVRSFVIQALDIYT